MATHIKEIHIETYRGINNLEIKNLADINIITGDNNSGKTSVLEVLQSLHSPDNLQLWSTLTRCEKLSPGGMSFFDGFESLFNVDNSKKVLRYSVIHNNDKKTNIVISAVKEELSLTTKEMLMIDRGFINETIKENNESTQYDDLSEDVMRYKVDFEIGNSPILVEDLYSFQRRFNPSIRGNAHIFNVEYISPTRHAEGRMFLSKVLDNPELYQQMLDILQTFDENIISINADSINNRFSRGIVYKILSKRHNTALPLNVYGDGMKKAILLMSAVIMCKDGILLLDEFETAIHTSAMDKIFKWILNTAIKLNVQLFITSHSEEAISKVLKCSSELHDNIRQITLYKNDNKTVARVLDGKKAIEAKEELGLELR